MEYKVMINEFEGPLDLLLHLIKEAKIDIYDIEIEAITKQYLDYIRAMEELNLSIASEYLVMAAELIEMKSRLLLPKTDVEEFDEYEEDPREALINRLIEYQKYKEVSNKFKKLEEERQTIYTKIPENFRKYIEESKIIKNEDINISDLLEAFEKFLERKKMSRPLTTKITKKEITVLERRNDIRKILSEKKKVPFTELFDIMRKDYIIVTFLAVLEMAKRGELFIKQDNNFDEIIISEVGSEINE